MKKTLLSLAMVAALSAGSASAEFLDFSVNPNSLGGAALTNLVNSLSNPVLPAVGVFTADKITGNYDEFATFTPTSLTGGSFSTSIKWQSGQFVANDGSTPLASSVTALGTDYTLYGLLVGGGTYSTTVAGVTTFTFLTGDLNVYYDDKSATTTFTNPADGTVAYGRADFLDDFLLATGSIVSGQGTLDPNLSTCDPGINCGSFGVTTTFSLNSPSGEAFFVAPNPFYAFSFDSGQLNNFPLPVFDVNANEQLTATQQINGSMDVVFQRVPEPSTIALMGLGLTGLGLSLRRRKAA